MQSIDKLNFISNKEIFSMTAEKIIIKIKVKVLIQL